MMVIAFVVTVIDGWRSGAWVTVATASALEFKDVQHSGWRVTTWDWIDWAATLTGGAIGIILGHLIN